MKLLDFISLLRSITGSPDRHSGYRVSRYWLAGAPECVVVALILGLCCGPAVAQPSSRVELHSFTSAALGMTKNYNVYLPPGYDSSTTTKYPVVYFLRGHEREWFNSAEDASRGGKNLKQVADTLLEHGDIGPMILVGPSLASTDNSIPGLAVNMLRPDLASAGGIGTGRFEEYFVVDLIRHIDSTYRTLADRGHRGVDGFSLGGYVSVMMGVKHPELFSSVGCYDGTHMWFDLNDPRRSDPPPDDYTWITTSMFDPAFGSPRDVGYMKLYSSSNIIRAADSAQLAAIKKVRFHLHSAAYDGSQGNLDRGNHIVNTLLGFGILNTFPTVKLSPTAIHTWYYADLHASESLVKHWQTFALYTGVNDEVRSPETFVLLQNYPNPFNSSTTIRLQLKTGEDVEIIVSDLLGRVVSSMFKGYLAAGSHQFSFEASDLASGIYYCRLVHAKSVIVQPMMLVR